MAEPSITGTLIDDSQDLPWLAGIALADFQDAYYIDTALALPPIAGFVHAPHEQWIRGTAWDGIDGGPHFRVSGQPRRGISGSPHIHIMSNRGYWRPVR